MKNQSLSQVIGKLQSSPLVRGVFITGSAAENLKRWSDLDLVVILDTNTVGLKSIYTMIDGHFADIFFFDVAFVRDLTLKGDVPGADMDGMFVTWVENGKIEYDPDGVLHQLRDQIKRSPISLTVTQPEQRDLWVKVNYNFIANSRYFDSNDSHYHQALEIRLAYSAVELLTAYFSFRGIPWRGEKAAVEYFQRHDPEYFQVYRSLASSPDLETKMKSYRKLFQRTLHGEYQQWHNDFVIPMSTRHQYDSRLIGFWESLVGTKTS